MLAQVQRFVVHGWPSQEPKGGVQQNWRRQELSVLDDCVLWDTRVVVQPPGRERVVKELPEIHARMKVWQEAVCGGRAFMQLDLEAKVRTCTKCQSRRPPELVSCPDPLAYARKRVLCSEQLFLSHGAG